METMTTDRVHAVVDSPIGELTLVADDGALVGLYLAEHRRRPATATWGSPVDRGDDPVLDAAATQLGEYFDGTRRVFDLPLRAAGNPFEQAVWALLGTIPYGETRSYVALARSLGGPGLARAVGAANGRNPLSVVVACHRVVGADGRLVGYAGGLARKRFLLDLEQPAAAAAGRLL